MQVAVYAGVPAAVGALRVAADVLGTELTPSSRGASLSVV